MKPFLKRIGIALGKTDGRDALVVSGVGSAMYGLWLVYPPSMFLGFGGLCLALWWLGRR